MAHGAQQSIGGRQYHRHHGSHWAQQHCTLRFGREGPALLTSFFFFPFLAPPSPFALRCNFEPAFLDSCSSVRWVGRCWHSEAAHQPAMTPQVGKRRKTTKGKSGAYLGGLRLEPRLSLLPRLQLRDRKIHHRPTTPTVRDQSSVGRLTRLNNKPTKATCHRYDTAGVLWRPRPSQAVSRVGSGAGRRRREAGGVQARRSKRSSCVSTGATGLLRPGTGVVIS